MKESQDSYVSVPLSLVTLKQICLDFEADYKMSSADFYRRYCKGEFVGIHNAYRWAGYWTAYLELAESSLPAQKGISPELLTSSG